MPQESRPDASRVDDENAVTSTSHGPPGGLTRLLEELARTPDVELAKVWQRRLVPGEVVGRFELVREVGRGGFGVVYEAHDRDLGRQVAFKALRPGHALDEKQVDLLRREAEAAAQLNHPNVVTIHDFGNCPSGPYLIMELLCGESLSQRLDAGHLPICEAVRIAREVAQALVHAHAAGVVHRDLKPGNVFVCASGAVKVLDFGLAHLFGGACARGGTPGYMAPEQCRGEPGDERTDLFGLGVLLYRMLTGRLPYELNYGRSSVLDEGPAPEPRGEGIPARLARLVGRLLAKDPDLRPRSAQEVVDDLGAVERALDPATAARRHARWLAIAMAGILAAGSGAAAGMWLHGSARALEQMSVAVADFENTTGDPQLEGLSGLLITSLEQSHRIAVVTRSRMRDELRKLGRGEVERIDEGMAREVGRVVKTRALILGSVRRFGEAYSLELRGLDPKSDESLFAVNEQVNRKEDVPALIDRISDRARRALRERDDDLRGARVEMGEAVTKNLDAYQHYFRGLECIERPRESLDWYCSDYFRAAVAADPNFALAHYELAYLGSTINVSGSAQVDRTFIDREMEASLRDERQLPARERSLALALKAHLAGDDTAALRRYDDLIRRYPDDKHALYLAGSLLCDRSDYTGAVPYLQKATELDPFFENAVRSLVHALGRLQRKEELRTLLDRWSHLPQNPALRGAAVRGAVWLGDLDRALAEAQANVSAATDPSPLLDLAVVQFSRGEFTASEQTLRRAMEAFPGHPRLSLLLTVPLAAQGRQQEALAQMSAGLAAVATQPWEESSTRARLLVPSQSAPSIWAALQPVVASHAEVAATHAADLALLGDVRHAAELKDHLRPHTPDRELTEAVLTWRAGDAASALARLKALDAIEPYPEWGFPPSYVLAEIASAAGEDTAVLDATRRFRAIWAHLGGRGGWTVPRMVFLEARALARLGRTGEARRALDRLLVETSHADTDAPLPREARALRASIADTK